MKIVGLLWPPFAMIALVAALFGISKSPCHAFHSITTLRPRKRRHKQQSSDKVQQHHGQQLYSTPFEADFYDNPYDDQNFSGENGNNNLGVPPDTKLVLGINKYSHDTSLCAADAQTGQVLFALSKERLSRRKHDGGNVATLVDVCLSSLQLDLDSIETVVMNNHHYRILPFEKNTRHLEWESGLLINCGTESGYNEDENLFPDVQTTNKIELSHHLAHAYSTACQAPFDNGLVVVMDGMGETYRTMLRAVETNDTTYVSDFTDRQAMDKCQVIPSDLHKQSQMSYFDWREAESVYTFEKTTPRSSSSTSSSSSSTPRISITPIFKRFTPENSPPVLYNHGFENMDSVGALYSRASSHIFGDWNACGKVMGLAPWAGHSWMDEQGLKIQPPILDDSDDDDDDDDGHENHPILAGSLYDETKEKRLRINRNDLVGMPFFARNDPDLFEETPSGSLRRKKRYDFDDNDSSSVTASTKQATEDDDEEENNEAGRRLPTKVALDAIALAHKIQTNLETVCIDLVQRFQQEIKARNLCLAGGVALNSVLNGRLARELGFRETFISPYPGDDGIAIGCCAYGLFGNTANLQRKDVPPPVWTGPLSPYLGPDPSEYDMKRALDQAAPWLEVEAIRNENARLQIMVDEIESGGVVAWYRSRSEMGPRALGHRSILADPRKKGLVRFINEKVKSRESFRPFAPSVLAEHANEWFQLGNDDDNDMNNVSPFMSMTVMVHEDKRPRIPAVTHVDGSSRLQTVTREAEPVYHKLISKFHEKTGVPMVLNTSFNTLPSEPIVESPTDAVRSFLYSMGSIEMLVMGDYVVRRKEANLRKLLGEATKEGELKMEPACPRRTGAVTFESSFSLDDGPTDESEVETVTKVRMPDRPMHKDKSNEWFELLDELEGELLSICDGTVTMNEIMAQYTAVPEGQEGQPEMEAVEEAQTLLQNIVHRLVRLYEHTLISW